MRVLGGGGEGEGVREKRESGAGIHQITFLYRSVKMRNIVGT